MTILNNWCEKRLKKRRHYVNCLNKDKFASSPANMLLKSRLPPNAVFCRAVLVVVVVVLFYTGLTVALWNC